MALPAVSSNDIKRFDYTPKGRHFERYYADKRYWQATCPFQIDIEIDPNLDPAAVETIEYRQYINGAVWVARGQEDYKDDPNGNAAFKVPPYAGQTKVLDLPSAAVGGNGLVWGKWKEDGEITGPGVDDVERYGYRATANLTGDREADLWYPQGSGTKRKYLCRDTPSIRGAWLENAPNQEVWVWIQLEFIGAVVQVEKVGNKTAPVRWLWTKKWKRQWFNGYLELFSQATEIEKPSDHVPL